MCIILYAKHYKLIGLVLFFSLVSGCANFNSIHRQNVLGENASYVSIDAKQRLMISRTVYVTGKDGKPIEINGEYLTVDRICNEPSPDTFSAYTAAIEANASKAEEITAGLKLATGENASTIGIRTQSIQLLRDALYRVCEAYLSDGITTEHYNNLLSKYQKSMVTLIAIEQITGAVRPAPISISAGSSISNDTASLNEALKAEAVAKATLDAVNSNKVESDTRLSNASAALNDKPDERCDDAQAVNADDKDECEEYADAKMENEALVTSKKEAESKFEAAKASVTVLKNNSSLTNSFVTSPNQNLQNSIDPAVLKSVSNDVVGLVESVYQDDMNVRCLDIIERFSNQAARTAVSDFERKTQESSVEALNFCDGFLKKSAASF